MKLKNKRTGEIIEAVIVDHGAEWEIRNMYTNEDTQIYNSLAELNEEWEDAPEEPKEYWYISDFGYVFNHEINNKSVKSTIEEMKSIGNYFETKEEAERAVEKLKAWKFLKDIGFKIEGIRYRDHKSYIEWSISQKVRDDHFTSEAFNDALHLLFGGEE